MWSGITFCPPLWLSLSALSPILQRSAGRRVLTQWAGGESRRSNAQTDQLARAREVALHNRRVKLKAKLEQRLAELRSKLPDLRNDQLEKVVRHLIELEDHHRTKLADATELWNKRLQSIFDEMHAMRKGMFDGKPRSSGKSVGTLSDVSKLTR